MCQPNDRGQPGAAGLRADDTPEHPRMGPFLSTPRRVNAECLSPLRSAIRKHADPHLITAKHPSQLAQLPGESLLI